MPGPIVRSGPSTQYQNNWDTVFSAKKSEAQKRSSTKPAKKKVAKKKKK